MGPLVNAAQRDKERPRYAERLDFEIATATLQHAQGLLQLRPLAVGQLGARGQALIGQCFARIQALRDSGARVPVTREEALAIARGETP